MEFFKYLSTRISDRLHLVRVWSKPISAANFWLVTFDGDGLPELDWKFGEGLSPKDETLKIAKLKIGVDDGLALLKACERGPLPAGWGR